MMRYSALPRNERQKRRRHKEANFVYVRYADDVVVLCNGTKHQAEVMREALSQFLKVTLRLELSKEKTRITHLNDGFKFLGFWIRRTMGNKGMATKVTIPREAMEKIKGKITLALAPSSHQDSAVAKILALNRLIGGWCRYDQYTGKASSQFAKLDQTLCWSMAHWLGRKFHIRMPTVMPRYCIDSAFVVQKRWRARASEFPTRHYKQRFLKPNPYLTPARKLEREALPNESSWTGHEARPGMAA
jgi:hypothetical protein